MPTGVTAAFMGMLIQRGFVQASWDFCMSQDKYYKNNSDVLPPKGNVRLLGVSPGILILQQDERRLSGGRPHGFMSELFCNAPVQHSHKVMSASLSASVMNTQARRLNGECY